MATTTTGGGSRVLAGVALALGVAGLLVSAYLTYEHFTSSTTLACPETATVNCAKVTTSQWSTFAGIPVAVLGLLFYVAMVALLVPSPLSRSRNAGRARLAMVTVGVLFALYLVWAELFRINAICLWCTAVHVITLCLFVVLAFAAAAGDYRESGT